MPQAAPRSSTVIMGGSPRGGHVAGRLFAVLPGAVVRPLAALVGLWWWIPFFGIVDLTVTWDPDWPVVLEASWGMFFTFIVGVPFMVVAVWPPATAAALVQLVTATAVLLLSAAVSREWQAVVVALGLALATGLVAALRGRPPVGPLMGSLHRPLLGLTAVAVAPWLIHALDMAAANRAQLYDADITNGVDHYSVQAAMALALVALTVVAGLRSDGRRLHGTTVALVAGYVGLVSYSWPGTPAGFSATWSVLAMAWAVAVAVATWWPRSWRRASSTPAGPSTDCARASPPIIASSAAMRSTMVDALSHRWDQPQRGCSRGSRPP